MRCCNHLLIVDKGVASCGVCVVGKMAKDIGTAIRKSIVVLFPPCLVVFLGFHPYMVPHFFCNLYTQGRRKRGGRGGLGRPTFRANFFFIRPLNFKLVYFCPSQRDGFVWQW